MENIISRQPINKTASLVTGKGINYNPEKRLGDQPFSITPIPTRKVVSGQDLTGFRVGRFVVIGLCKHSKNRWVVRCDCGNYSIRRAKSIKNKENTQDRCEFCKHDAFIKRRENYRVTGRDADINDY